MKLILKEVKFIKNNSQEKLHFETSNTDIEMLFNDSVDKVTHVFEAYEFKKIDDKDIYYLYPTLKDSIPDSEIEYEINKILLGDDSNIINSEDTTITMPVQYNTIFWDVMNSIIIVFGKDNFKKLLLEIEVSRIPKCINFNTEDEKMMLLERMASPVYMKAKTL